MVSGASFKFIFLVLILFGVGLEIVGDVLFKKWAIDSHKNIFFIVGFLIYALGTIFWAVSLKYGLLSKAISLFTILNLVIIILVGMIFFHENISLINKLGVSLGIISVILMEI